MKLSCLLSDEPGDIVLQRLCIPANTEPREIAIKLLEHFSEAFEKFKNKQLL